MQPVSLTIRGDFWDSQIYSGDLILFRADGALSRLNWDASIDHLANSYESIGTALRVAFSDSDLFYNLKVRKVLKDPQIDLIIRAQLEELAALPIEALSRNLRGHLSISDTPFPFLSTDTEVYYNQILAGGDEGLFSIHRSGAGVKSMLHRVHKHHDGRILQVKASNQNTAVAAAAGGDGLFEFAANWKSEELLDNKKRLTPTPCSGCDWAFKSVFGWNSQSSFLASFREETDPQANKKVRRFDKVLHQEQIFEGQGFSLGDDARVWGSQEKVFCISGRELKVLTYQPPISDGRKKSSGGDQNHSFSKMGFKTLNFDASQVVSTGTAPFGTVIELFDRLVVLRSDGEVNEFVGESVHWRVFPRSENYSNQLHIIYEDHIQIVSFVHDYFVDQSQKLLGFARGSDLGKGMSSKKAERSLFN